MKPSFDVRGQRVGMPNERLRALLLERGITPAKLAEAMRRGRQNNRTMDLQGRTPYRRHRYAVAALLRRRRVLHLARRARKDEVAAASESEIVSVYPHRWAVPREIWGRLFEQAEHEIGVLVYSGMFLGRRRRAEKDDRRKGAERASGSAYCSATRTAPRRRAGQRRGHR